MKKEQYFVDVLHQAGQKATPARLNLLSALEKSKRPLNVKEIQSKIKDKLDQVTTYRTLELLTAIGIVKRIDFQRGHAYYELQDKSDHHHLVCNNCGTIEDFEGCSKLINRVLKQSKQFSQISGHSLELFGLCKQCA